MDQIKIVFGTPTAPTVGIKDVLSKARLENRRAKILSGAETIDLAWRCLAAERVRRALYRLLTSRDQIRKSQ
jgi:hypothetical protein